MPGLTGLSISTIKGRARKAPIVVPMLYLKKKPGGESGLFRCLERFSSLLLVGVEEYKLTQKRGPEQSRRVSAPPSRLSVRNQAKRRIAEGRPAV